MLIATGVVVALSDLFLLRRVPGFIWSGNGPAFIAQVSGDWIAAAVAGMASIAAGSLWGNGYVDSINAWFCNGL